MGEEEEGVPSFWLVYWGKGWFPPLLHGAQRKVWVFSFMFPYISMKLSPLLVGCSHLAKEAHPGGELALLVACQTAGKIRLTVVDLLFIEALLAFEFLFVTKISLLVAYFHVSHHRIFFF